MRILKMTAGVCGGLVVDVVVMLATALPLAAGEEVGITITPEEIVQASVAHSLKLRSADWEIAAQTARQDQADALAWPSVGVDARATRYEGLEPWQLGPGAALPPINSRYGAGITVTQPLYTGGTISSQKAAAARQKGAAYMNRSGAEADIRIEALLAYWSWSKACAATAALQSSIARVEAHTADMQNQYDAGLATDNDLLSTQVLLDQTRLRLDTARRRIELARIRLATLTGRELPPMAVPEAAEPPVAADVPAEHDLLTAALATRPERSAAEFQVEAADGQVEAARGALYPQLYLVARYEQARPNPLNVPPRDQWDDDAYLGVTLSWNIFDAGLLRGKVREAAARREQARLAADQVDERITLEVREARIALADATSRLTVAQRVEQSARRNIEAVTDQWQNGLARHSEVLDAEAQFTDALYEVAVVKADIMQARAALDHATGRLAAPAAGQPGNREE